LQWTDDSFKNTDIEFGRTDHKNEELHNQCASKYKPLDQFDTEPKS